VPAYFVRQSSTILARSCEAQPTEWQHIGNQINAAMIFLRGPAGFAMTQIVVADSGGDDYDPRQHQERLGYESGNLAAEELRCLDRERKVPTMCGEITR
jgi:hypothetical protein